MKKTLISLASFLALFAVSAVPSLAITFNLTNGGLGQAVSNPQQFGVAVCNNNSQTVAAGVLVSVTVGSENATVPTVSSIAGGKCGYTYVPYSQLGMQAGKTYTVSVAIDPQHSVTSNANTGAAYTVTVPTQVATTGSGNLTANVSGQFANPFALIWNWIVSVVKAF